MPVRDVLQAALDCLSRSSQVESIDAGALDDARTWLARNEIFLDWITRHPKLVEINCEAAHLLIRYRGG
jgi:hypothetical protein